MVIFIFLDRRYAFCINLVQKFKTVSLRQNLIPKLISICKILSYVKYYLLYLCPSLDLDLFMSYICDLFFYSHLHISYD